MADEESAKDQSSFTVGAETDELYFNGVKIGIGSGDVVLVLQRNNKDILTLNCSYTVAKTLGTILSANIQQFEEKIEQTILTTHEVNERSSQT